MACNLCSSPPTPDYSAAATAQGAANKETAIAQSLLNNPNMVTPYGSQIYSGGEGGERPTLTQQLSPAEQAKLDAANRVQAQSLGILEQDIPNIRNALLGPFGMEGQALEGYDPRYGPNYKVPYDLSFAGAPGMPVADANVLQQVEDAMYAQGAQYLDPQWQQSEDQMRTRLANQGIASGSDAYNTELSNFGLGKQKAYSDLTQSSILGGQTAMQNLYNMAMSGRQQGVNEATTQGQFAQQGLGQQAQVASNQAGVANAGRAQNYGEYSSNRTMPLNMLNAMLTSGQVNNPTFQPTTPTSITPAPIMQGAQLQGQQQAANSSANAGLWGNIIGGAAKIGAAAIPFSDRRLKTNIRQIGEKFNLPWYEFDILGEHREGVMADEAEALYPEAIVEGPCGFKMVNYAALGA